MKEIIFMNNYYKYQFPWQILMLLLFVQSSFSQIDLPEIDIDWFDKLLHFLVFGFLGLLITRGLRNSVSSHFQRKYIFYGILFGALYGASDEIHQLWVPGRHSTVGDWIADLLGVIVFILAYQYFIRQKTKNCANTGR